MANPKKRRIQNHEGNFYVDETCIDCDTCRWMAPEVFNRQDELSAVYHQPEDESERLKAYQALLSCPTQSIGTIEKPRQIQTVQETFPLLIEDNVYHCGYHAEASFAATSYFIKRIEGNILIDSPRFAPPLVKKLEALGGVKYMYLTHQDDVADHQKFKDHFGCERILHQDDITQDTSGVEIKLKGLEPYPLAKDLLIIPVPGHSKGHTILLYLNKFLFSGDHLAWSETENQLIAFKEYCFYSWSELIKSTEKLTQYTFEWILPGHGRRYHGSAQTMNHELRQCINWMRQA